MRKTRAQNCDGERLTGAFSVGRIAVRRRAAAGAAGAR